VSLRLGPPLSSGAACAAAAFDGSPRDHYFPRLIDHEEVHHMPASDTLERGSPAHAPREPLTRP